MKKIFLVILGVLALLFLILFVRFFLIKYFPHERISISLPFAEADDDLLFINPMGETDNHPKPANPHGHPGLDFAWNHKVSLIASVAGRVTRISKHKGGPQADTTMDVEVVTGIYAVRYTEIEPRPGLKAGQRVNKGDIIGYPGAYMSAKGLNYSTHWELDYNTPVFDRLCPLTYFDIKSLVRINAIWKKVGDTHNGRFSEVCSGDYKSKDE